MLIGVIILALTRRPSQTWLEEDEHPHRVQLSMHEGNRGCNERDEAGEVLCEAVQDDKSVKPPSSAIDRLALRLQIEEWTSALDFLCSQRIAIAWSDDLAEDEYVDIEEIALRRQVDELLRLEADARDMQSTQALALEIEGDERVARKDHAIAIALGQVDSEELTSIEISDIIDQILIDAEEKPSFEEGCIFQLHDSSPPSQPEHCASSGTSNKCKSDCYTQDPMATADARFPCIICFDEFDFCDVLSGGDMAGPSSSSTMPGCGHYTCRDCMRQHALRQAEVLSAIDPSQRVYCPFKECSALLMSSEDYARDRPSECLELA
eukprot:gene25229-10875_t